MNRGNYVTQKPENVLKRVNELIHSPNGKFAQKEKKFALEQLHNIFCSAKKVKWQKHFEPIMKRHLELCVDLKDHHTAKDGLHQYRNMVLRDDPNSLEVVIVHLMDMAEVRAAAARESANNVALVAAAKISDLEQQETPESIMLSSMTEEGSKDRTDREVVVPWLKFLWEIYRAILELLHRQAKLERLYHKTCEKAYKFCLDFKRTHEFRKLCDMMRMQLSNLQKMASQPSRGNRISWEWTSDSIEFHLQTRFAQLEVATSLELWNEGFRTVEDIYSIIQIGKKTPKSKLMVSYYEKLTRIFLVSENYLFHAYAWYKYYSLSCECRKDMKPEERQSMANAVLLSAMCIPSIREFDSTSAIDAIEATSEKTQRMATLLDFHTQPSRSGLVSEIISKGILDEVSPEVANMYADVEMRFQPLSMVKSIAPAIDLIKSIPLLQPYAVPIQKVVVVRTMQQLARVYNSVKLDFVRGLFSSIEISFNQVEKLVIDAVTKKQLNVRIDHLGGCFRFGTTTAVASTIDTQILDLGNSLSKILKATKLPQNSKSLSLESERRQKYLCLVSDQSKEDHAHTLERKMVIEQRKEALERLVLYKDELKRIADQNAAADAAAAEAKRVADEVLLRTKADNDKKKAKIQAISDANAIIAAGKNMDLEELVKMDEAERKALLVSARKSSQKSKEEDARRLTDQVKRLDHITRALRMEAKAVIAEKYSVVVEQDRKAFEDGLVQRQAQEAEEHKTALVEKERMSRMQEYRVSFEADIVSAQRRDHEASLVQFIEKAKEEYRRKKVTRARRALADEEERLEEEAESERQRLAEEQSNKDLLEKAEMLRRQRQDEEDTARQREDDEQRRSRDNEEKLRSMRRDNDYDGPMWRGFTPEGQGGRDFDRNPRQDAPRDGPRDEPDRVGEDDRTERSWTRAPLRRGEEGPPARAPGVYQPRMGGTPGFSRTGGGDPFDRPRDGPQRGDARRDPFDGPRGAPGPRGPIGSQDGAGAWTRGSMSRGGDRDGGDLRRAPSDRERGGFRGGDRDEGAPQRKGWGDRGGAPPPRRDAGGDSGGSWRR